MIPDPVLSADVGTHEGGCLCGAARYRLAGRAEVVDCHCRACRRASGAAFVTWLCLPAPALRWTAAPPAAYASSAGCRRRFCAICGATLAMEYANGESAVAIGTLDDPGNLRARLRIWSGERIAAADGAPPDAPDFARDMPQQDPT